MALKELPVGQIGIETLVMRTLEVKYTLNIYNKKIIYLPWWGAPIGVIVSLFCALITIAIVSTIIFLSRRSCSLAISVVEVLEEIWTNLFWCYSFILHQLYIDLLFVSCNHWFVEQFYQKEMLFNDCGQKTTNTVDKSWLQNSNLFIAKLKLEVVKSTNLVCSKEALVSLSYTTLPVILVVFVHSIRLIRITVIVGTFCVL